MCLVVCLDSIFFVENMYKMESMLQLLATFIDFVADCNKNIRNE